MPRRMLAIYLKDHLAGSTAGVALAKRCAKSNAGTPLGRTLAQVAYEIEADRQTLRRLMADLGIRPSLAKNAAAWLFERLARLKPNGRLSGSEALHRVHELETLSLGIAGKQAMWEALRAVPGLIAGAHVDLDLLDGRARSQRERVETARIALAGLALAAERGEERAAEDERATPRAMR